MLTLSFFFVLQGFGSTQRPALPEWTPSTSSPHSEHVAGELASWYGATCLIYKKAVMAPWPCHHTRSPYRDKPGPGPSPAATPPAARHAPRSLTSSNPHGFTFCRPQGERSLSGDGDGCSGEVGPRSGLSWKDVKVTELKGIASSKDHLRLRPRLLRRRESLARVASCDSSCSPLRLSTSHRRLN